MIRLHRGKPPAFWTRTQVKSWTKRWLAKGCSSTRWLWPTHQGKRINLYAAKAMWEWHYGKCAFCEAPLYGSEQVEHFRSKTRYPLAAFVWRNLFLSCPACNTQKGLNDHAGCLKPDRNKPEDYLWVNPISRCLEPKPGISLEARQCALNTIRLYKLDRPQLAELYLVYLTQNLPNGWEREALERLADEKRPFSLMVKSLLAYQQTT